VEGSFVFLENRSNGFKNYLAHLTELSFKDGVSGAIVLNANPFTKGHLHLVETAASQCDHLHLFVVSEDKSLFPYKVRRHLVEKGTEDFKNVSIHESGPYIISNATFPSYFLKDEADVMKKHALLDATVFTSIAKAMNIKMRFVAEEPFSAVTSVYNMVLSEHLPQNGVDFKIIPRLEHNGTPISASNVRLALKNSDWDTLESIVPQSTLEYLQSPEAEPVIEAIKARENVVHH
jgi:[citrate (pro-3S)-lyase] ligase